MFPQREINSAIKYKTKRKLNRTVRSGIRFRPNTPCFLCHGIIAPSIAAPENNLLITEDGLILQHEFKLFSVFENIQTKFAEYLIKQDQDDDFAKPSGRRYRKPISILGDKDRSGMKHKLLEYYSAKSNFPKYYCIAIHKYCGQEMAIKFREYACEKLSQIDYPLEVIEIIVKNLKITSQLYQIVMPHLRGGVIKQIMGVYGASQDKVIQTVTKYLWNKYGMKLFYD